MFRTQNFVETKLYDPNSILYVAIYIYEFLFLAGVFKILYQYVRWVWPVNIFSENRDTSRIHVFIIGGIVVSVIYDFLKWIWSFFI